VLAPFLVMDGRTSEGDPHEATSPIAYLCFEAFIDRFLRNMYLDKVSGTNSGWSCAGASPYQCGGMKLIPQFSPLPFLQEFRALQCIFHLFRLVLLYHNPTLCQRLDKYYLPPELYLPGWVITVCSRTVDLSTLFHVSLGSAKTDSNRSSNDSSI